ncbi:hypothetical protein OCU04_005782 [Sclerotinia nivalis]|uniref:Uncharacterized protein n=1 Tax=Sclerotinia nivalis TaxID=352851 RepID=A0A9X0ALN2_9HELO|nr:hypothetical protein OCU04_005782 [Sclerotinia nivalis]
MWENTNGLSIKKALYRSKQLSRSRTSTTALDMEPKIVRLFIYMPPRSTPCNLIRGHKSWVATRNTDVFIVLGDVCGNSDMLSESLGIMLFNITYCVQRN